MSLSGITGVPLRGSWRWLWLRPLDTRWYLTQRGLVTHICVGNLTIIGPDNGLSPGRRQAIIWTNAEILLIGTLGTNFSEILIEIYTFSFKKMHLKMSSAKWRPFCLGLNVLRPLDTRWYLTLPVLSPEWLRQTRSMLLRPPGHQQECHRLYTINTLRPRQNGRRFPDDIFKGIFLMKMNGFRVRFHWKLFLRFELTIFQHWFR